MGDSLRIAVTLMVRRRDENLGMAVDCAEQVELTGLTKAQAAQAAKSSGRLYARAGADIAAAAIQQIDLAIEESEVSRRHLRAEKGNV